MTKEELKEILDKHLKWLRCESGGSRADLSRADLSRANLSGADLSEADLSGADLSRANLYEANLYEANLSGADLSRADLSRANLSRANLYEANLYEANLYEANLYEADLSRANLSGANLSRANLYEARIELNLVNKFFPICCPEHGSFTAWKKVRGELVVKLEVMETAKRSSAYGRKCRCSEAKVVAIENFDGSAASVSEAYSQHDNTFVYRVGETVKVEDFDDDRRNECAPGIHFFITRQEAVDY